MKYRFMNDYSADWPFWGGADVGLCADGDPALPAELTEQVRAWALTFNEKFSWEHGWPDRALAAAHRTEGLRLHREIQRALPEHEIEFQYWERAVDER